MPKGKGRKRININFRQSKSSRSADNSSRAYICFNRMLPFLKRKG